MADIESTTVNSIDLYSIPAVLTVNTAVVDACTAASPREGAMIHLVGAVSFPLGVALAVHLGCGGGHADLVALLAAVLALSWAAMAIRVGAAFPGREALVVALTVLIGGHLAVVAPRHRLLLSDLATTSGAAAVAVLIASLSVVFEAAAGRTATSPAFAAMLVVSVVASLLSVAFATATQSNVCRGYPTSSPKPVRATMQATIAAGAAAAVLSLARGSGRWILPAILLALSPVRWRRSNDAKAVPYHGRRCSFLRASLLSVAPSVLGVVSILVGILLARPGAGIAAVPLGLWLAHTVDSARALSIAALPSCSSPRAFLGRAVLWSVVIMPPSLLGAVADPAAFALRPASFCEAARRRSLVALMVACGMAAEVVAGTWDSAGGSIALYALLGAALLTEAALAWWYPVTVAAVCDASSRRGGAVKAEEAPQRRRSRRLLQRCGQGARAALAFSTYGVALFLLAMWVSTHDPAAARWAERHPQLRGVNLGGWLVGERWLNYKWQGDGFIFHPNSSESEEPDYYQTSLARQNDNATAAILEHRDKWFTRETLLDIAARGVESVRVPFGYWLTVASEEQAYPYLRGRGLGYLDDVLDWAEEANLTVMLDLHAAPGSQSGEQQSGRLSHDWRPEDWDAEGSLAAIETVAERFANRSCIIAVELLNEPLLDAARALDFYQRGAEAVRRHMGADVAVVINLYRAQSIFTHAWGSFDWNLPARRFPNVLYDFHVYTCFHYAAWMPLWFSTGPLVELYTAAISLTFRPTLVGEFSNCVGDWYGRGGRDFDELSREGRAAMYSGFGRRQVAGIFRGDRSAAAFFWTWYHPDVDDVDALSQWDLKYVLEQGLLPGF